MTSRLGEPVSRTVADATTHHVELLRLDHPADRSRWSELMERPGIQIHDTLAAQLRELVRVLEPARAFTPNEWDQAFQQHLGTVPLEEYGVWVFYPWSDRLVHLLDEEEFVLVRTDRNRNKITREEQQRLSRMKVGVVGLSVGRSVALAMALERSFGELRLADHDTLDLSNLNRIRAGVHELGINKTIATAREIAELDPFLRVTCQPAGLTRENIDAFFSDGGRLDLVVEECDSVDIKILVRQKAKALRIPVLMDTSDRGMLDVERFDLEPDRPILHGLIEHLDPAAAAQARTNEEKIPFLAPIAGMDELSTRMKASMVEVGQTIATWPQLATGVILGGALVGDTYRRIALNEFKGSGRWYVDLDRLISKEDDNAAKPTGASTVNGPVPPSMDVLELRQWRALAGLVKPRGGPIAPAVAQVIAEAGIQAPSADNMQPWSILFHDGGLYLFHDRSRSSSMLDSEEMIPHLALGMCLENMLLKAAAMGSQPVHELFPLPHERSLVAVIRLAVDGGDIVPADAVTLAAQIARRHTNRKRGNGSSLEPKDLAGLEAAISDVAQARLHTVTGHVGIQEIASICGAADRLRVMNDHGHDEFFRKQLRWSHAEAERTRDGLDIETLELTATERVGLRMAASPHAMRAIRGVGGGKALEKISADTVRTASAIVLLSMPSMTDIHCIDGGRASQLLWLKATELDLSVHPLSAPIFLARPARRPNDASMTAQERAETIGLHDRLKRVFDLTDREPMFMARLSRSERPSTRSLRRELHALYHTT